MLIEIFCLKFQFQFAICRSMNLCGRQHWSTKKKLMRNYWFWSSWNFTWQEIVICPVSDCHRFVLKNLRLQKADVLRVLLIKPTSYYAFFYAPVNSLEWKRGQIKEVDYLKINWYIITIFTYFYLHISARTDWQKIQLFATKNAHYFITPLIKKWRSLIYFHFCLLAGTREGAEK